MERRLASLWRRGSTSNSTRTTWKGPDCHRWQSQTVGLASCLSSPHIAGMTFPLHSLCTTYTLHSAGVVSSTAAPSQPADPVYLEESDEEDAAPLDTWLLVRYSHLSNSVLTCSTIDSPFHTNIFCSQPRCLPSMHVSSHVSSVFITRVFLTALLLQSLNLYPTLCFPFYAFVHLSLCQIGSDVYPHSGSCSVPMSGSPTDKPTSLTIVSPNFPYINHPPTSLVTP
jgi:hypothetical protein